MSTRSHTPSETQFRTIDGLSIRFAQSEQRAHHALLQSPCPESLLVPPLTANTATTPDTITADEG